MRLIYTYVLYSDDPHLEEKLPVAVRIDPQTVSVAKVQVQVLGGPEDNGVTLLKALDDYTRYIGGMTSGNYGKGQTVVEHTDDEWRGRRVILFAKSMRQDVNSVAPIHKGSVIGWDAVEGPSTS